MSTFTFGRFIALTIVISGSFHLHAAEKGSNYAIEGILIISVGLIIDCTEKIIHAINKGKDNE